jgi:hypothetical protein
MSLLNNNNNYNIIIMFQQDYILLIMNCKKYSEKAAIQKKTWLKDIPNSLIYYHVIGDKNLEQDYYFDNSENLLIVKTLDDYNSLPKKVIASFNAIFKTYKFKYLFKTDDDQMVTNIKALDMIMRMIEIQKEKSHYGGQLIDVEYNYLSQYYKIHPELPRYLPVLKTKYCSGRFYFLSSEAIDSLITKREKIEHEYLEDYAIGFNLDEKFKNNILQLQTGKFFIDFEDFQLIHKHLWNS